MKRSRLPVGWNEARIRKVLAHYEGQTEDEAALEDEVARPVATSKLPVAAEQADQECSGPVSGATVVLRILPRSAPASRAFRDTLFGYADGSALASVFYGRVEDLARDVDRDEAEIPVILGHAMAHGIGHLLLGSASHSKTGIMCGQWDRNYLRRTLMGRRVFSPEQMERIKAEVLRRIQGFEVPTQR